jgi:hypothetical protein
VSDKIFCLCIKKIKENYCKLNKKFYICFIFTMILSSLL